MSKAEGCSYALVIGLAVVVTLAVCVFFAYNASPWACEARWPERETSWAIATGCLVDVDGEFIPEVNVRDF